MDAAQTRIKSKAQYTLVDAESWDKTKGDGGLVIEPHFGMLMLRPRARQAGWYTSTTSPYDKTGKAGFSGLTSASWIEHDRTGQGGGRFLTTIDASDNAEVLTTTATLGQNRGFVLSYTSFGDGSDFVGYEFGITIAASTIAASAVGFKAWASGNIQVYREGTLVNDGNVTPGGQGSNTARQLVELYVIPCRRNGILIISNSGGSFYTEFEDVSLGGTTPQITPDGSFWISAPTMQPDFQFAPMKFSTSGYVVGTKSAFRTPPPLTDPAEDDLIAPRVIYDLQAAGDAAPTAQLRNALDSAAFVSNGTNIENCIRIAATGSGTSTPFVYGAQAGYEAVTAETPDSGLEMMEYARSVAIAVPESPGDVEVSLEFKTPYAVEQAGASKLRAVSNRPVRVCVGDKLIIDGRTCGHSWADAEQDEVRRFGFSIRDQWRLLERLTVDDPIVLDGLTLKEALELLLEYAGFDPETDADIEDTTVEVGGAPPDGAWNFQIAAGTPVGDVIHQLMADYAGTWIYGFKPVPNDDLTELVSKFFAKSPEELGADPVVELFPTIEEAKTFLMSEDGGSMDEAAADRHKRRHVYRSFEESVIEPEANQVIVTGLDSRTGKPIQAVYIDDDSINPETAVVSRPDNWQGEPLTVGYFNPAYRTDEAVDDALAILQGRLTQPRRMPTFGCEMLFHGVGVVEVPVWRGDVVRLHRVSGNEGHTDYRIKSFDGLLAFEPDDEEIEDGQVRPFMYTGEEVAYEL